MGVKGAKNKKDQDKWNKFVSTLVEKAALPKTCLVRLTFTDSEGTKHEINNFDDLKELASSHGIIKMNCFLINIDIEVLALTFNAYQKRFKFEQDEFMKKHKLNLSKNNISDNDKQLLSKFVLSPLTTTKATLQRKFKSKKKKKKTESESSSPSINIMDMLNVNPPNNNNNNNSNEV